LYNNVTVYSRPFATELGTRNWSEAWLSIGVFTLALVYSVLYQGHWAEVRDYVNILDKGNWKLFGIYSVVVWSLSLIVMPGILYILSFLGVRLSKLNVSVKEVFLYSSGALLPLGLMLWISFVIPMLFVNVTFVLQSASDPFGWGWDFFGTANIPWHQLLPKLVPWIQAVLILAGLYFSLRNLKKTSLGIKLKQGSLFKLLLPTALFLTAWAIAIIFFFTN
jgi:hypothetical protein